MATESPALRYIETSALLAALLENDEGAIAALRRADIPVTSALTLAEAYRSIVRGTATNRFTAAEAEILALRVRQFATRCNLIEISTQILARAGQPFPAEPVRTLDAIHLASFDAIAGQHTLATIVTRDNRIRSNALAMGHRVE